MNIKALPQDSFREIFKYLPQKDILRSRFIFHAANDFVCEKIKKYKDCNARHFKILTQNGEYIAIKYLFSKLEINEEILSGYLEWTCEKGDKDLVLLMIEKGASDWNSGLWGACYGGKMNTALLMIEKGANNWNWGLYGACSGGKMNTALLMIEKGANDWNWGLRGACFGEKMNTALLMIEKGANDWNWGLRGACYGGHMDLALLMIEKGANDWNWGLRGACSGGKMNLALLMIEKGAASWNLTFEGVKLKDHIIFSQYMRNYNAPSKNKED